MTCREATEFLMDYLTDELSDNTRRSFEQHLSVCPNCRAYLAVYRTTIELGRRVFNDQDAAGADTGIPEELVAAILAAKSAAGSA